MAAKCLNLVWQGETFKPCPNPVIGGAEIEWCSGSLHWVYWCQHHEHSSERRLTELVSMALLNGFMSTYLEWLPSLN